MNQGNEKKFIPNNILLQIGYLALVIIVFIILIKHMITFIPGVLSALCLYVLLLNPLRWMVQIKGWNKCLSVLTLMSSSAILIFSTLYIMIQTITKKVIVMFQDQTNLQDDIKNMVQSVNNELEIDLLSQTNMSKLADFSIKFIELLLNASFNSILQLTIAFFLLYFMLMNNVKLEKWFYQHIPFRERNLKRMNVELKGLIISNAVGVPITAFLQSLIAYIGYLIFGVEDALVWFILTCFAAMLPVVGAALIYIPLCVYLLSQGDANNALFLFLYCIIIVGLSDNLIRFILQKKMANIHPLITIFGVIIGVNLFGFIGIIFGPILFSVFIWLLKLYKYEFIDPNPEELPQEHNH